MNRRHFLQSATLASTLAAPSNATEQSANSSLPSFDPEELSVSDLGTRIAAGSLTSEALVNFYLDRIEKIDRNGPALRSVIEVNPDAIAIARALDGERKAKGPRGPLHGLPVLIKDNIDTGDKMQTTAGSLALAGQSASRDSAVAARLRSAGAVILGKTNLSEWANFRSTHSTSGWSGRGGLTRNPYALDRNPCGSSSGSGVAVSANLSTLAVGSETDGSVVCPSSMNGIVGIKPTLGLISRAGIIPIAHSQDTAGPMARSVRDAAVLLGVLAAVDPRDPATEESRPHSSADYTKFLDPNGLRGARIGVARQYFTMGPAVTAVMESAISLMRKAGAQIIDPADLPQLEPWHDSEMEVLLYEFKADLNAYLAGRNLPVKSLADCIKFNATHKSQEMPYFAQELMEQAQTKGPLTEKAYTNALARNHRLSRQEGIDATLQKFKLDAIVGPTAGPAWMTDLVDGDHPDSGCASPPAVAGYPHITVPAGFVFGLPVGLSFFGTAWTEPRLITLAYAFEQIAKARRKPKFLPSVDLSARGNASFGSNG